MSLKISVITAAFNCKENLLELQDHLKKQTYTNFEWIIVDGDSDDGTKEFLQTQTLSKNWISEPDNGIYDALNKGIRMASGEVIGFLHSDDIFSSENILESINKGFDTNDIDGVYGDLQYVKKNDIKDVVRNWKSRPFSKKLLKQGWMPAHPTLYLKYKIYENYGLFNLNYKIAADYDFMVKILKHKELNLKYIPMNITTMRLGGLSNRSLKSIIQKSKEDFKIIKSNQIGGIQTLILKNLSKLKQFYIS
jgi:glycosyltransferase involved in cell wall biosynthesis